MKIKAIQYTLAKKKIPVVLLEVIRCPDGVYGACVRRDYKTDLERAVQIIPINQIVVEAEELEDVPFETATVATPEENSNFKEILDALEDIKKELKKISKPSTTTKKKPLNE